MTRVTTRLALPVLVLVLGSGLAGQVTFVDVGGAAGVDVLNLGRGAAWADLDNDGLQDLILANGVGTLGGLNSVLRHQPDHTFEEVGAAWGLPQDHVDTFSVLACDLDNDGDRDLYYGNGGFFGPQVNQLFRNDLSTSGVFTDMAAQSGDAPVDNINFGLGALDYDLDGDLDVFCSSNDRVFDQPCYLLRNDGALVFSDVSSAAGIDTLLAKWRHVGIADFDLDGYPDVGVGSYSGANALWRNNGDATFTDVAAAAGVDSPSNNYGFNFHDLDNDGWVDVFLPKYNLPAQIDPTTFLLNDGDGTFTDVTANTAHTVDMGHGMHDLDNDGYPDALLGTGFPGSALDDVLYWITPDGQGGIDITDGTAASGILAVGPTRCHGVAYADYDEDGDVDVLLNLGGMGAAIPGSPEESVLWENQGTSNHWIEVDLTGVLSPREPAGARVEVASSPTQSMYQWQHAVRGFGSGTPRFLHIGLGADPSIDAVRVRWPSGVTQTYLGAVAETRLALTETGMRLTGAVDLGATVQLDVCGGPGYVAELLLGTASASLPLPQYHGVLEVAVPFVGPFALPLDAQGQLSTPLPLPNDPLLSGNSIFMQAWVHEPGGSADSTLSNLIELAFP